MYQPNNKDTDNVSTPRTYQSRTGRRLSQSTASGRRRRRRRRVSDNLPGIILISIITVLVIVLVCLILNKIGVIGGGNDSTTEPSTRISVTTQAPPSTAANTTAADTTGENTAEQPSTEPVTSANGISSADLDSWELTLVNPENYMDEDYAPEIAYFGNDYRIDARIVDTVNQMIADAYDDGAVLYPVSAYRDWGTQEWLYGNEVDEWLADGYNEEEAKANAATEVAIPGTSEHQLGLAIDWCSVEVSFENTAEFDWLSENAHKYGFVLRFPEDKVDVTMITYEPWHYRYVGVKHAEAMRELGITTLEEYRDHLASLS